MQGNELLLVEVKAVGFVANLVGREKNGRSVNVTVSECDFGDLRGQILDAIRFLNQHSTSLQKFRDASPSLDFGIWRRDVAVQTDSFPAELLALAGGLGIGIDLSLYPKTE